MSSVSISTRLVHEKNQLSEMLATIFEHLTKDERIGINQWQTQIEEHAELAINELDKKSINKRRLEITIAAIIYDTFLEFESRTNVIVGLKLLGEIFNINPCSINSAWSKLFDNRIPLRKERLIPVRGAKDISYWEAVCSVMENLTGALTERTSEVETWITEIQWRAIQILESVKQSKATNFDAILVGTAAIYAAIREYPGKPRVQAAQRDLAELCGYSPSMLSKVWLALFSR